MPVSLGMLHAQSETQKEEKLAEHFRKEIRGIKQQSVIMEAALWRLRFRHAYTMMMYFELAAHHHGAHLCYYTASGIGPAVGKGSEDYGGITVEYKHTPREWIPIWNNIVGKLLKKVKEVNERKRSGAYEN